MAFIRIGDQAFNTRNVTYVRQRTFRSDGPETLVYFDKENWILVPGLVDEVLRLIREAENNPFYGDEN